MGHKLLLVGSSTPTTDPLYGASNCTIKKMRNDPPVCQWHCTLVWVMTSNWVPPPEPTPGTDKVWTPPSYYPPSLWKILIIDAVSLEIHGRDLVSEWSTTSTSVKFIYFIFWKHFWQNEVTLFHPFHFTNFVATTIYK